MAADEAELTAFLKEIGVAAERHGHPPFHTVEESQALRGAIPGVHVKNMFMKDKKGALWLVTCREDRKIRIKDLEKALGAPRMSFGKPDLLWEALGVKPGAVTPLAILNDRADRRVRLVLDAQLMEAEIVNCHPLHNEATLSMASDGLRAFVAACGHAPIEVDFDALEAAASEI